MQRKFSNLLISVYSNVGSHKKYLHQNSIRYISESYFQNTNFDASDYISATEIKKYSLAEE